MKRCVLVGAGKKCSSRLIESLKAVYSSVIIADNTVKNLYGYEVLKISELKDEMADVFFVTSPKFEDELLTQLLSLGIDKSKVFMPEQIGILMKPADDFKFNSDMKLYEQMFDSAAPDLKNFRLNSDNLYPVLDDYRQAAGSVDSHYFYMDILTANLIINSRPKMHFDVGSRVEGFISHLLAAGVETTLIDIRPLSINDICTREGIMLHFLQGNAVELSNIENDSIASLSSLHAVEHFGLGRYGDPIDPMASFKAMAEFQRVLAKNGTLYFGLPVGKEEKLCFNAHRIFSIETVLRVFSKLKLKAFYLIHNGNTYEYTENQVLGKDYESILGEYDCGVFVLGKI